MKNPKILISIILILIITFVSFYPSLKNNFTNWDDDRYVTKNTTIHFLSLSNIKRIFTSFYFGNYHPLTILSYSLEYSFFKANPIVYHLTNLILHLFNCLLVFWLIYILTGKIFVSFLTTILFSIHPLHVESVAWISERKDVLYAFFFLASIICYCYYLREKRIGKYYYFTLILFTLSLLSKAMAITLPLVLILIDYLLHKKHEKYKSVDKIPFFVLAFIFGIIAVHSQNYSGPLLYQGLRDVLQKIIVWSYCIIFYLDKIFMPINLSCLYPYNGLESIPLPLLYPTVFMISFIAVIISYKYTRKIIFGSAFFLITIVPVVQIVPLGETIVADRYTYISSIGVFYLLAEMFIWVYARQIKYYRVTHVVLSLALIGTIGVLVSLSWNRCKVWRDSISLWSDVIKNYPTTTTAYNNRGLGFYLKGEYEKAQADFDHIVATNASYYRRSKEEGNVFYNLNLSCLYNSNGQHEKAIALLENAIQNDPAHKYKPEKTVNLAYLASIKWFHRNPTFSEVSVISSLSSLYEKLSKLVKNIGMPRNDVVGSPVIEGAIFDKNLRICRKLQEGSRRNPYLKPLISPFFQDKYYINLAVSYAEVGQSEEAQALLEKSIAHDASNGSAYYNLSLIYKNMGSRDKAIALFNKTIEVNPGFAEAYYGLGILYQDMHEIKRAIAYYTKAIQLDSNNDNFYNDLATAYISIDKEREAIAYCKKAIKINNNSAAAYTNLGYSYCVLGKNTQAILFLNKALELNPNLGTAHKNLAVAYYYNKKYELSIKHVDRAIALGDSVNSDFLEKLKPYRK